MRASWSVKELGSVLLILLTADRAMGMLLQLGHTTSLSTRLRHHHHHHETDYLNFHLEDEHTGTVPDFFIFFKVYAQPNNYGHCHLS